MMQFFRYREDRTPTLLITGLFLLDVLVYLCVDNILFLVAWMLVGLAPKACVCAWNHHHQHLSTFVQTWPNRLLEIVYAAHTGIVTNAWVLHHNLGHHLHYLNQEKDESRWKRRDGKVMGAFEYTVRLALTGYIDAYRVGLKFPRQLRPLLYMGAVILVLFSIAVYYRPVPALLVFAIPMLIGYVITCWHTYYHHAGLDTDNECEASYNIMHKWYNVLTGNLGYHTAHHMKQGLHWSKLPEYHRTIKEKIPARLFCEPCIPFKWMPAA